MSERSNPKYPVYVISKGRWDSRLTQRHLAKIKVPHYLVVEPTEADNYRKAMESDKTGDYTTVLELPFHDLGQASIPARNWVWDHSIEAGDERHWILDDNIRGWYRFNRNMKVPVADGTIFRVTEDFTDRYENVAQSGMQYYMFAPRKWKYPVFYLNTRIYSCILNSNTMHKHRWRGRYNEDTDLSLNILKDGFCTILINTFLANKMNTMTMRGGNTEQLYDGDGRLRMAQALVEQHPDVVRLHKRWGRYQHLVDYRPFKANLLLKKEGLEIPQGVDNYGMVYQEKEGDKWVTYPPEKPMARFFKPDATPEEKKILRARGAKPATVAAPPPVEPPNWDDLIIKES